MPVTFSNPPGGIWPLGFVTVTTSGTPVQASVNVGPQTEGKQYSRQISQKIRQMIFTTPGANALPQANTGNIYICFKGFTRSDPNGVMLVIPPGETQSLPNNCLFDMAKPTPDFFWIDADVSGDGCYIAAVRD